jgi:hypothetical protein
MIERNRHGKWEINTQIQLIFTSNAAATNYEQDYFLPVNRLNFSRIFTPIDVDLFSAVVNVICTSENIRNILSSDFARAKCKVLYRTFSVGAA